MPRKATSSTSATKRSSSKKSKRTTRKQTAVRKTTKRTAGRETSGVSVSHDREFQDFASSLDLREGASELRREARAKPAFEGAPPHKARFVSVPPRRDFGDAKEVRHDGQTNSFFMNTYRFVVLFSVLGSALALGASSYLFFFHGTSSGDVAIRLELPEEVHRGVPFDLEVSFENNSEGLLEDAEFSLLVPRDVRILDSRADGQLFAEDIGDIGSGSIEKKTYRLVAVASVEPGVEEERIAVRLSYSLGKSSGFEAEEVAALRLGDSAFQVRLQKDETQVLSGSTFRFSVLYENVSDSDIEDIRMSIGYPDSFRYVSSGLPPDSLDNYWKLGALRSGSEGKISIQGVLEGADNQEFLFPVQLYGSFLGRDYVIEEYDLALSIAPSPIGLSVSVNGRESFTAKPGDTLRYEIHYFNLSGVELKDFVIRGTFLGEMFDFSTLQTSSTLDSRNRFVWDRSNTSEFERIQAGARGSVSFLVRLKEQFPIFRVGDKNFSLQANVEASSPTVPYYLTGDATRALTQVSTKVRGRIQFDAKVFYRDADSGIANTGSIPPKVEEATEYTIHWVLRNESTDVRDVEVRSILPFGVEWTGQVASTEDAVPFYDELTREITWAIPEIGATKGVLGAPVEAIFQVRATPDSSHVGKLQTLLNESSLTAVDQFTGATLQASDFALTTALLDDPTVGPGNGIVVQ